MATTSKEPVSDRNVDSLRLDQPIFTLVPEPHDIFTRMLDNPPEPGPKLRALMRGRPAWTK